VLFWGDSKRDRGFDIIVRLAKTLPELRFRALLRWQGAECAHDLAQFDSLPNTETLIYPYTWPLSTYIGVARLVLLPFRFMGVRPPLSLLEAMAMGKCVVTTPMAGNEELIRHGETGFIVDFDRDWDTAMTLLAELAGDHDRRECVGRAAQAVAEQIRHDSCEGLELFKTLEGAIGPSSQS
jgi:glycosyltransferase involved in cell wall biosynthesis